jgi:hypothetical protein
MTDLKFRDAQASVDIAAPNISTDWFSDSASLFSISYQWKHIANTSVISASIRKKTADTISDHCPLYFLHWRSTDISEEHVAPSSAKVCLLRADFSRGLLFNPEGGIHMFLRNVAWFSSTH